MAGRFDITIYQGASLNIPITITNTDGTAFNLTNWTPRGQIRRTHRSTTIVASFTFTVTNAVLGKMDIKMTDEITKTISAGETINDPRSQYQYDIEIEHTDGTVKRILEGVVYVDAEVTRT
jgi:hypothetical protein